MNSCGGGGGAGDKADYFKKGPRPIGGMPSLRVFLGDPSPYLREFRRKPLIPVSSINECTCVYTFAEECNQNSGIYRTVLVKSYALSIK